MTQIRVIFWDLEDVCVKNIIEPALNLYGVEYGEVQRKAWKECITGRINEREFFRRAVEEKGLVDLVDEIIAKAVEIIKLKENGALPLMKDLNGKIRQGVISNQSSYFTNNIDNKFGIKKYIEAELFIVSSDVGYEKSGTKIFEIALQRAGIKGSEALFFDDKQKYVDVASKVGLHVELFTTEEEARKVMREKYNIF